MLDLTALAGGWEMSYYRQQEDIESLKREKSDLIQGRDELRRTFDVYQAERKEAEEAAWDGYNDLMLWLRISRRICCGISAAFGRSRTFDERVGRRQRGSSAGG